eukprot:CAMPEP_0194395942 /NCGR_PEP_ID=MMETSP0174-20130528/124703_1 /TAXON_ID=216777 /ORGANISM="Proboscia alata, Strain PI-D3" /LENGTH=810 /DNA_ID=CAMNT_0039191933 /DNA_START=266 /DNA_END=2697 /DNA_ORIENTATION=+
MATFKLREVVQFVVHSHGILVALVLFNVNFVAAANNDITAPVLCGRENKTQGILNERHGLMNVAVCYHAAKEIEQALVVCNEILNKFHNYSCVKVNSLLLFKKSGNLHKALLFLESYNESVGGMYGDSKPATYDNAIENGPPCVSNSPFRSDCVSALNTLASAYISGEDNAAAFQCLQQAIEIGDEDSGFSNISGEDNAAAFQCLQQAIEIGDEDMLKYVHSNLGGYLQNSGDMEGAAGTFLKSFWISVKSGKMDISTIVRRAILVSPVPSSVEDAISTRKGFEDRVKDIVTLSKLSGVGWENDDSDLFRISNGMSKMSEIRQLPPFMGTLSEWTSGIQTPHFFLHYYGFHDRANQELVAQMYEYVCPSELFQLAPHLSDLQESERCLPYQSCVYSEMPAKTVRGKDAVQKLRIGFVSSHFGINEPHGLLLIDVIRRLPPDKFYSMAVGVGPISPSKDFVDALSGEYFAAGYSDSLARRILMSQKLDCLIFAEMQNEAILHFLGFQRFAPVQILVMGAPVSSGNPSIDYFISGDRLEHPFRTHFSDKEEHYSEQVVLFEGQAISFPATRTQLVNTRPNNTALHKPSVDHFQMSDRLQNFGIPYQLQGKTLYMCFQNLYKLQPLFDYVLASVLHGDESGHIILQAALNDSRTKRFSNRLKQTLEAVFCPDNDNTANCVMSELALKRIHFIPRVQSDQMAAVLSLGTVVLHPFPFGGSKTAFDALLAAVPLVTFPQPYLRGRMAASFFITMELHTFDPSVGASVCCVASSISDYVSKSIRLGNDKIYRDKVIVALKARNHRISDDKQTSFEW